MPTENSHPTLKVTVLGSGTSTGVPLIGCKCPICLSDDPRDKRTRSSIFVEMPGVKILIDTTPDLRQQALREGLDHIDAVLFTHAHADHILGFDDLRRFCDLQGGPLPIYATEETMLHLQRIFFYAFDPKKTVPGYVHVTPHLITGSFELGGMTLTPLSVPHGSWSTLGFLFNQGERRLLAYLSDCANVPAPICAAIKDVEVLIIDGLRDKPHPTHLTVSQAVAIAQAIGARQTLLTHQTHDKCHADRSRELPPGIEVAYDGRKIEI
ncbi:MAG: MBL fold metallo-hydrolase [Methylacidiphilales bacterium]|nr:MBL fold metallo-hydrolase [Candidatus Methylacidiphilales bacterium]